MAYLIGLSLSYSFRARARALSLPTPISPPNNSYTLVASPCASSECDPVSPRIPTQIVGDVTYFNYGFDGSAHTLASSFLYSYQFANTVDGSTGDATSGPKAGQAGLTGVYYGVFDISSGFPEAVNTGWIINGCESGTVSSPLTGASYQCAFSSNSQFTFTDNAK